MEKSYIDLFKNGVNNDNLNLLHECSKAVNVAVKTPVGISKEKEINNIILQRETMRSIICTSTEIFLYKWKKDNKDKESEFIDRYEGSSSIETKTEHEYLGLMVSDDGSNKKSIDQKVAKAQGIINDIVTILETLHLGKFFFETALLLRNSLFI